MKQQKISSARSVFSRFALGLATIAVLATSGSVLAAATPLADTPVRATSKVPANVMLALSVEWPTGVVQAYNDEVNATCPGRGNADPTVAAASVATSGTADSICYIATKTYIGYFDPFKCYNYDTTGNYFVPVSYTIGASAALPNAGLKTCAGQWSGNFLNWATMQTTDMFRWAMTGGDRFIDTSTLTVLEKARHDGQGSFNQFPLKRLGGVPVVGGAVTVTPVAPSTVTPFMSANMYFRTQGLNTVMWASADRALLRNNNHPNSNNPNNDLTLPAVTYDEAGLCGAIPGCVQVSTLDPGTRRISIDTTLTNESGQCATAPANVGCVNTSAPGGGTANVARNETANDAAGLCPANGGVIAGVFISCTQTTQGEREVSYRENNSCPGTLSTIVPAGATNITCVNRTGPRRDVSYRLNRQCNGLTASGTQTGFVCTNRSQATRQVTRAEVGQCGLTIVGGFASCVQVVAGTAGTRTATYRTTTDQAGQCATYVGAGTCANLTAPGGGADVRRVLGPLPGVTPYYIRVKVCDQAAFPETQTTCTLYSNGTSYKPTGTVQENALNMRFGAFGYLLDNSATRDGGVLRAKMKDVGPLKAVPQNPPVANAAAEWSATDGTYVNNPDSADATATGFSATNSGVINYLNKFGRRGGYKGFDPVSEMYAEVIKYFKAQGRTPTTSYVSGLTNTMVDGFPVITAWNDPIQYSCQQNFVIGIADANTHKDKNLSGGIVNAESEPAAVPGNIDTDYNVTTITNAVGALESTLVAPISNPSGGTVGANLATLRNCCNGTAFLAGLAYYAHTTDLRADFDNLNGPQVLTTFYVDVREAGSWGTIGDPRNQLWLAAKYGGFKDNNKNSAFDAADTWADAAQGIVQGRPVPKNYFAANQPEKLVDGLQRAFREINGINGSGAGVGVAASNLSQTTGENGIYQVKFDTTDWSGTVSGFTISGIDQTTGAITLNAAAFESGALLLAKALGTGWDTGRVMITAVPGATQLGQPFRFANLNATQLAALGPTAVEQQDVINYIRGQKTKEENDAAGNPIIGGKYRVRTKLLADIVDSEAVYVGTPRGEYLDEFNPGYNAFKVANRGRTPAIYVGANAGQLHAFNAIVDPADSNFANAGKEIMAYVPSLVYVGPNNTPTVDGLRSVTNSSYVHHYMVNATPSTRDVDFNNTDGSMTTTPNWRTLMVGGLGKGGRGFYALDVTDPANFATEATAATKVLWEYTDDDMGYSLGLPLITKTRKWGWVVLVSSGYNNITSATAANRGKGYLYVLNARTGALLQKIGTGVGTAADPSGFSPISGYTPSFADYTTDEVYGGDLFGNVWRFDFRSATAAVPAPLLFATLKDAANVGQPITTIPLIEYAVGDGKRYVFVGTGRFLDTADIANAQQQTFYAIRDGNIGLRFETTASATGEALPSGVTFPITRADLFNHSDLSVTSNLTIGLTSTQIASKPMGWYYDLGGRAPLTGTVLSRERISLNPKASQGFVTWVGNVPDTNACNPNGLSRQYATTYGGGKSLLYTEVAGVRTYQSYTETRALVKSQLVNVGDGVRILGTDDKGVPFLIGNPLNAFGSGRLLNWREILQ